MLPFFTIFHSFVDACSVTVVGVMSRQRALAYNALAFALQFPFVLAGTERELANELERFISANNF